MKKTITSEDILSTLPSSRYFDLFLKKLLLFDTIVLGLYFFVNGDSFLGTKLKRLVKKIDKNTPTKLNCTEFC